MAIARLAVPGTFENRAVRLALGALLVIVAGRSTLELIGRLPVGVDLEIPLRAATRWLAGGQPYLPQAFDVTGGPDLPFLYPPPVLPLVAALTALPRTLVLDAWVVICGAVGILAAQRLGFGRAWWPILLLWPPVTEAVIGGNAQIFIFAATVVLLYEAPGARRPFEVRAPAAHDPRMATTSRGRDGLLAAVPAALKVSPHTWVYVLRRRPIAALFGLAVVTAIAALTLPLVGIDEWFDWVRAAGRSSDPSWVPIGVPLSIYVPHVVAIGITFVSVGAAAFVPPRFAAPWLGVLSILGSSAMHLFGLMALLPAMLVVRREIALVAAILISTGNGPLIWTAVALTGGSLLGSHRFAWLREPASVPTIP